jgi:phage antirepressor YoqD-like protein
MNGITKQDDKRMTVREVADVLGVSEDTVLNSIKSIEAQSEEIRFEKMQGTHGGKPYYTLSETQVTAVKMNLRKNSQVAAMPKTELEKELIVQQALVYQQEKIRNLTDRLAIAEPKAEVQDKITATDSDISVRELAAILAVPHLGQNNLFERLRKDGYIDSLNRAYRQYIENGIMYEKEYYVPGLDEAKRQLRITQKGVVYFTRKYGGKVSA